jgi:hypothetical protein
MITQAIDILNQLGVLPVIQMIAIAAGAIFIYNYFMSKVG